MRAEKYHFDDMGGGRVRVEVARGRKPDGSRNRASKMTHGLSKTALRAVGDRLWESLGNPYTPSSVRGMTLERYLVDLWLPEVKKKVRMLTYEGYEYRVLKRVVPMLGSKRLVMLLRQKRNVFKTV